MTDQRAPAIIVAGHVCLDVIPSFGTAALSLEALFAPGTLVEVGPPVVSTGGAVSNTGLALHRLGVPVRLVGKVGDDLFGRAVRDVLRQHAPPLADGMIVAPGQTTSYTVVLNPPGTDRMFLHCPGANDTFRAEEIDAEALRGARLFHFGYPPLMRTTFADGGAALEALFGRIRRAGTVVSLDMASPDPSAPAGRVDWAAWLARVLPSVDLFAPSLDELLYMLDRPRYDRLQRADRALAAQVDGTVLADLGGALLERGARLVLLKLGQEGLYLRTSPSTAEAAAGWGLAGEAGAAWNDRELLVPCFSVEAAGTTGAGDCTIAGFLAALLHGQGPEDALTTAVAVGACSVEQADATSGIPAWADVQARIRQGWPRRATALPLDGWTHLPEQGVFFGPHDRVLRAAS